MTAISFNFDSLPKLHRSRFQTNHTMLFSHERTAQGCDSCKVVIAPVDNLPKYSDQQRDLGWWIEVFTAHPACIYYFGVFENPNHAEAALPGFMDDLLDEGARGLVARIDFHTPLELTVDMPKGETLLNRRTHFPPGVDLL
jgi:hypothetical protein